DGRARRTRPRRREATPCYKAMSRPALAAITLTPGSTYHRLSTDFRAPQAETGSTEGWPPFRRQVSAAARPRAAGEPGARRSGGPGSGHPPPRRRGPGWPEGGWRSSVLFLPDFQERVRGNRGGATVRTVRTDGSALPRTPLFGRIGRSPALCFHIQ